MKINIWKLALMGTLCTISFSAYAWQSAWRCEASNYNQQAWYAISGSESKAAKAAMKACQWNSSGSCYLSYCAPASATYSNSYDYYNSSKCCPDYHVYQCNVADRRGYVWYGVAGGTSSYKALRSAYKHCKAGSRSPGSCYIASCFIRQ